MPSQQQPLGSSPMFQTTAHGLGNARQWYLAGCCLRLALPLPWCWHASPPPARVQPAAGVCRWGTRGPLAAPGWALCHTPHPQSALWGRRTCGSTGDGQTRGNGMVVVTKTTRWCAQRSHACCHVAAVGIQKGWAGADTVWVRAVYIVPPCQAGCCANPAFSKKLLLGTAWRTLRLRPGRLCAPSAHSILCPQRRAAGLGGC